MPTCRRLRDVHVDADNTDRSGGHRALFDALPVALVMGDLAGLVLDINDAAALLLGVRRTDVVGRSALLLVHPDDRAGSAASAARMAAGGIESLREELRFLRPDGTTAWGDVSTNLVVDDDGRPQHWLAVVVDITARKAAESAQRRLASAVQTSTDAIVATTLEGTITSWNPGAERVYGYPADDVLGADIRILLPPELRGEMDAGLEAIRLGGTIESYETMRLRRDGTVVPVSIHAAPVRDDAGAIVGASSVARDLTDRERANARFKALLDAGADPSAVDARFGTTPLQWAEHAYQDEAADLLRTRTTT